MFSLKYSKSKIFLYFFFISSFPAFSQSSLTLRAILDEGYATISNADNYKSSVVSTGHTWAGAANGGLTSSRYGALLNSELSSGFSLIGNLEAAFYPTTLSSGNTASQGSDRYNASIPSNSLLFSREAYIGVNSNKYGLISFGRSTTITYEQTGKFDPTSVGPGLGNFGAIGSFGVSDLTRADNQIKYYTANINGFVGGLAYSAMGGVDDLNAGTTKEIYLSHKSSDLELFSTYLTTTTFAYNQFGLTASNSNLQKYYGADSSGSNGSPGFGVLQLGALYYYENFKFTLGYDTRRDQSNSAVNGSNPIDVTYAGFRFKQNNLNQFALAYYRESDNTVASGKGNQANMLTLQYILTPYKNFDIYAIYSRVGNQNGTHITVGDNANIYANSSTNTGTTPNPGELQIGYMLGLRYQFEHIIN